MSNEYEDGSLSDDFYRLAEMTDDEILFDSVTIMRQLGYPEDTIRSYVKGYLSRHSFGSGEGVA